MALQQISIDDLPDEVLVMIMSSLCTEDIIQCSMVCRHWQRLTTEEALWREAKIMDYTVIPLRNLAKLIQRGIRKCNLSYVMISDPDSWSRIFSPPTYKSQMTFLDLTETGLSDKALQSLLKPMNQLEEIRLGGCTVRLNRDCCSAIAKNKQLRTLDMSECRSIDTGGLRQILKNCQRLEDLDLSETNLNRKNLDLIATKLPASLLRLNLRNCGLLFSDEHLKRVVKICPNLTHLDISSNRFLSHLAVQATTSLRNLEELKNEQENLDSDDDYDSADFYDSDAFHDSDSSSDSDDANPFALAVLFNYDGDFNSSSSDSSFNFLDLTSESSDSTSDEDDSSEIGDIAD